ncbi:hypothetical protein CHARACLAT_005612 [Characodon lateralis]|uniref:Uncharacterized protein n=1 Tax=Characodon lateralis TaxID=208331 RepID=A0ABU7DNM3_9TELE|nr:hypothetical protein [Characodon lateralis]
MSFSFIPLVFKLLDHCSLLDPPVTVRLPACSTVVPVVALCSSAPAPCPVLLVLFSVHTVFLKGHTHLVKCQVLVMFKMNCILIIKKYFTTSTFITRNKTPKNLNKLVA